MSIKRVLCLCFGAILLFAICGCTGDAGVENIHLSDVLAKINEEFSVDTKNMKLIEDTDALELYYGINPADVKQFAAETTKNSSTDITELIFVEAVDDGAAERVYDALELRYNSQRDLCASYSAELLAIVDQCCVERRGNFVSLIMSSEFDEMSECYNSIIE